MTEITNKKRIKGLKTRNRIIDEACKIFIQNGYHATTTREITDPLGLAPSALYNHFDNKEKIFEAVIEKYHPWREIPNVIKEANGKDVESVIRDASKILLQRWGKRPELSRLHLIEMLEFKGIHLTNIFRSVFSKSIENYKYVRERNVGLKEFNKKLFVRSMIGLFFGFIMSDRLSMTSETEDLSGGLDYFADTYLKGVFVKEAQKSGK